MAEDIDVVNCAVEGLLVRCFGIVVSIPWNTFGGLDSLLFMFCSTSCVGVVLVHKSFDSTWISSTQIFKRVAGRSASRGANGLPFLPSFGSAANVRAVKVLMML